MGSSRGSNSSLCHDLSAHIPASAGLLDGFYGALGFYDALFDLPLRGRL